MCNTDAISIAPVEAFLVARDQAMGFAEQAPRRCPANAYPNGVNTYGQLPDDDKLVILEKMAPAECNRSLALQQVSAT